MAYVYFDSSYAPCSFLIVPDGGDPYDEGTTQLCQTSWDYPGVASRMGWSLSAVPAKDNSGCQHRSTDGTVDCPCGATSLDFITSAGNYIREHEEEEYPDLDEYLYTDELSEEREAPDQHLAAATKDWSSDAGMAERAERMGKKFLSEVHNEFNPDYERGKKKMNASLAETLVKTARILCEEDHVNADSTLQIMVGDPNDSRTSTFVQFKPNPGSMQLPNPLSPIEGDEIFFAYLIPGAIFQAHDGTEWWIDSYTAPDEISISNRWYPRINAFVSINDIRRSIHQWVEPITQTVPPPPPGVDYSALPVRIVDGPGRPDENIGIGGGAGINGGW